MRRLPRLVSWLERRLQPRRYRLDTDRYVDEICETQLRYHEGGRSIVAGYEGFGEGELGVFPDQIGRWEPAGDDDAALDDTERERIISAIRQAFAGRGIVVADTAELASAETGIALVEARNRRTSSTG